MNYTNSQVKKYNDAYKRIRARNVKLVMDWVNEYDYLSQMRRFWLLAYLQSNPDLIEDMCLTTNPHTVLDELKQEYEDSISTPLEEQLCSFLFKLED